MLLSKHRKKGARPMIIDCHVHAGELNKHYPVWWIEELYRVWGGVHQWTYDRPTMSVGERLVYQMDQVGIDMMCVEEHRLAVEDQPESPSEEEADRGGDHQGVNVDPLARWLCWSRSLLS